MKEVYKPKYLIEQGGSLGEGFLPAPDRIVTPYPFLAVGDIAEMVGRFAPGLKDNKLTASWQQELLEIQERFAPENSSLYYVEQGDLISRTEGLIEQKYIEELSRGNTVGIINFDKYLLADAGAENILKLNLSRSPDGSLTSRPGSKLSKDAQITMMADWLKRGQYSSIILTDDVVAFGETFQSIIGTVREGAPGVNLQVVCGICSSQGIWAGREKLNNLGVDVASVITATASSPIAGGSSGMAIPDSRDFTIFGGKVKNSPNGRTMTFPYFYPFSKPLASFFENGKEQVASRGLLAFNRRIVGELEKATGKRIRIGDLEDKGFGVPYSSIPEIQAQIKVPEPSMLVSDYLKQLESL